MQKSNMENMASLASLVAQVIAAINGNRGSYEQEEKLRRMMQDVMKENSTSSQDRAMVQNLMSLLETCIGKHQNELQAVAQDREAYKAQVDDLSRRVEELMRKDKESSSTQSDLSIMAKMELFQILEKYKQERRRQRSNEASNYASAPPLPWADDKKPYQIKPQHQGGGAYGKFDRQNKPGYHDQRRRRMDEGDKFVMVDHRDCKPQYQRSASYQKPFHYNHPPQNYNFHKFAIPDNKGGAHYDNPGPQNFSRGESRDGRQETGNRGGKQPGPYNRGGRSGPHFNRGGGQQFDGNAPAGQAGYGNKQFHHEYNPNKNTYNPNKNSPHDQGSGSGNHHSRGQFHNRGQGRGQFHGRGNFHNRGPFQQNRGQTSNKEDDKKSEQDVNLSGLSQNELEVYTQMFLQFQQQQEALKKGQENNDTSAKSAFKKKRRTKKKKAEPKMKVNEKDIKDDSDDDSASDSDGASAEEASAEAASDNRGVKKKISKNVEGAKESDSSTAFEMFKASDFDLSKATGVDPKQELKDVMMIARKGDDFVSFVPKTVRELLDFKEKHPNAETLFMKKK